MKFQLLCQYYTKNLGSINCQANGFPFLFCHSHCLLETIAHTEKWILDFDTMVSASFNSRFTVEFLCSAMATQVIDTTVRFPYCFIIRKEKKKHQELSAFPEPNGPTLKYLLMVQFSSVAQSCPTLCDPMNCCTPGLLVHHQLPESTQTHVHRVSDAIQPSHPLSSPCPPAPNPSQHQSLFQ